MPDKPTGRKIVCPRWLCFTFDNPLRRLLHHPETILGPYVHTGNTVIDVGAGVGYFSIPLARLVGPAGHVTAIDIQTDMLSALVNRARKAGVSERIKPHLASPNSLGHHARADFVNAFWMVHEVPNQFAFLTEIFCLLKPEGFLLFAEPVFHVRKTSFLRTIQTATGIGFVVNDMPKIRLSHSVLLAPNGEAASSPSKLEAGLCQGPCVHK
ncbi:MAG TPA: methyltransferase domain-containing protein [Thermodesulfobacteriota bacterium]|nr:methyltransferase domain-containing protein [Thermodesulfobacteriota bacterium]